MLNRANLTGWANLGLRLSMNFGLIFLVHWRYGADAVKAWLVYITLMATIQATDGLISQYFLREILHLRARHAASALHHCLRRQLQMYALLAIAFSAIGEFSLGSGGGALLALPLLAFVQLKVHDSRARAVLSALEFQGLEFTINAGMVVVLLTALVLLKDYRWLPVIHLCGQIAGLLIKARVCSRKKQAFPAAFQARTTERYRDEGLWQSVVIALGGSLVVNLALLTLQSLMPSRVPASILLTYRITALICEIASVPLIIRIPEVTRLLAEGNRPEAMRLFSVNYRHAMWLCLLGLVAFNAVAVPWRILMPKGLQVVGAATLIVISAGWLLERSATLLAQLQMSMKRYEIVGFYGAALTFIAMSVAAARFYGEVLVLAWALMAANALIAGGVLLTWRRYRD